MNPDPKIRVGSHQQSERTPERLASFKGKSLEVSTSIHEPKASGWDSFIDFIATPLHALRKFMSSRPYSALSLEKLFDGEGHIIRTGLGEMLQTLGHSLKKGYNEEGRARFQKQSWGLDFHLRDEFLAQKDGLMYLGHFRAAIEEELHGEKGLYQQYKEALANYKQNPSVHGPALKALEEQIAGAEALLHSHENIIARELF